MKTEKHTPDILGALNIVLELARGNVIEDTDDDALIDEHNRQMEAIDTLLEHNRLIALAPRMEEALEQANDLYSNYALLAQPTQTGGSDVGRWINEVRQLLSEIK